MLTVSEPILPPLCLGSRDPTEQSFILLSVKSNQCLSLKCSSKGKAVPSTLPAISTLPTKLMVHCSPIMQLPILRDLSLWQTTRLVTASRRNPWAPSSLIWIRLLPKFGITMVCQEPYAYTYGLWLTSG